MLDDFKNAQGIAIDIETIPSQVDKIQSHLVKSVEPDGRLKDQEKIEADIAEKKAAAMDSAGLHGWSNHIICIGFGNEKTGINSVYCRDPLKDEADMVCTFFSNIKVQYGDYAHEWIGHNLAAFDFRVLRQRCIVLGIKWPAIFDRAFRDKWGDAVFDTMLKWTGNNRDMISLEKLCLALGVETPKQDMDGSQVYAAWQEGRHDEIRAYCEGDVAATYKVYQKMKGAGL